MNLDGKRILIVGAGKSGIAAANLLHEKKMSYMLYDGNETLDVEELKKKSSALFDCEIYVGELTQEMIDKTDVVVMSPGVPTDLPVINRMREAGIPIWGEIELAYYFVT